ncbi:hypothetical protein KSF_021520 [Reticulibacter mediterranei]|uniref:Uncharacterized protein n=1 Tax=Reticulibacter mediterranei TaxID=2778369 RepID=A0A8J3IIN7_9CHLR|nr:hypothetical protein KSF_021520 [Reticulibacter mediterranei]
MPTIVTLSTRNVMSHDYALTNRKLLNSATTLNYRTGQLMPQNYRGSGSLYDLENI